MKKKIITGIILSAMVISNAAVFAAESGPILTSAPAAEEALIGVPEITVDKEIVDLSKIHLSQYIFEENGNVMVPLRAVAETMGFTVSWDEEKQAITVGDNEWEAVLYIGIDSYVGESKIALGMSTPQSYGAAPQLVEGTTFVPAKMFEIMGYTYQSVGQFVDFKKIETAEENVEIPNPIVVYENIEAAKKALSFTPATPSVLPAGYELREVSSIGKDCLQIVYTNNDDNDILYRTAKGTGDISGDYNTYKMNKEVHVGALSVTLRGNAKISNATWQNSEFTFSVSSDVELEEAEIVHIIKNVK